MLLLLISIQFASLYFIFSNMKFDFFSDFVKIKFMIMNYLISFLIELRTTEWMGSGPFPFSSLLLRLLRFWGNQNVKKVTRWKKFAIVLKSNLIFIQYYNTTLFTVRKRWKKKQRKKCSMEKKIWMKIDKKWS